MADKRLADLDFWRGVALAIIFINHIPGNLIGYITPRNYGFSDSAEAFVFIAGVSVIFAYSRRFQAGHQGSAAFQMVRRAVKLYAVHLFLTAIAIAFFLAAVRMSGAEDLLTEHGRALPVGDPVRGVVGILTLGHQIGFFNILPLYVVLLGMAPLLIVLGLRDRWLMLMVSGAVYVVARITGANLPSWPEPGGWYFNPLAWQFLFALGLFAGLAYRDGRIRYVPVVYQGAFLFTLISAMVVSNVAGLVPGLVDTAGHYLDWGKTELGIVRLIDFLALAYVLFCSGAAAKLKSTVVYDIMSLLGRQALVVFCLGSLLSALGQVVRHVWSASPIADVAFVLAGLWVLYWMARSLEQWGRRSPSPSRG